MGFCQLYQNVVSCPPILLRSHYHHVTRESKLFVLPELAFNNNVLLPNEQQTYNHCDVRAVLLRPPWVSPLEFTPKQPLIRMPSWRHSKPLYRTWNLVLPSVGDYELCRSLFWSVKSRETALIYPVPQMISFHLTPQKYCLWEQIEEFQWYNSYCAPNEDNGNLGFQSHSSTLTRLTLQDYLNTRVAKYRASLSLYQASIFVSHHRYHTGIRWS